jgi:hypothetical protein
VDIGVKKKVADGQKSGSGADDIKVSKWFACPWFTFLDGINKPRQTKEWKVISLTATDFPKVISVLSEYSRQ